MLGLLVFSGCALLLIAGYALYGRLAEKVYGADMQHVMPCVSKPDGVDFVPMPTWKILLIQLLNIAGLGPVVGAVSGCLFGPAALLWIVVGCIFAGAMHDFLAALMSAEKDGANLPELVGENLGRIVRYAMRGVCIFMLGMVGVVFTRMPADMLGSLIPGTDPMWWGLAILLYYFMATILPINAIIGRFYPLFGALFLFMAVGLAVALPLSGYTVLPNLDVLTNVHPKGVALWPTIFVTIACGAISGFHATQSPMMVRCLPDIRKVRKVFYGAMIIEGLVALVWATVGLTLRDVLAGLKPGAAVNEACQVLLGPVGAFFAVLGVVALAVTSGDTAMRSCRLMLADVLHLRQRHAMSRLALAVPLFACVVLISHLDFDAIWRYFGWANQSLACITLWTISVNLRNRGRFHWLASVPALFMSAMCCTFLLYSPDCLIELPLGVSTGVGCVFAAVCLALFLLRGRQGQGTARA